MKALTWLYLTLKCRHRDRKSTRLNSSHGYISYAVFCLKKKTEGRPPGEGRPARQAGTSAQEHAPRGWAGDLSASAPSPEQELAVVAADGDDFFNDTATTEIYTLSLHDALPI